MRWVWPIRIKFATVAGALVVAATLSWTGTAIADTSEPNLRTQLREFAKTHHFVVQDLDRIDETSPKKATLGTTREQLERLLENYGYVTRSDAGGSIVEVWILGAKNPSVPPGGVLPPGATAAQGTTPTEQSSPLENKPSNEVEVDLRVEGNLRIVHAFLMGHGGKGLRVQLALDLHGTAAVLPMSMSAELGFDTDDLQDGWTLTEHGGFAGRSANLKMVRIADVVSRDVLVVFVNDSVLGGHLLLGVGALQEFSAIVDDIDNKIIFVRE
jgi:hypothetical protein